MTDHPGSDEPTRAGPSLPSPVRDQINLPSRRLGWISLLLVVAGVWLIISGIRTPGFSMGPVTFSLNEVSFTAVGDVTWFDVFRQHEFSVGLTLALMGIVGFVALLAFHSWRGAAVRRTVATEATPADVPVNNFPLLLGWLAAVLAVMGVAAFVVGLNFESDALMSYDYSLDSGWRSVIAPRAADLGLIGGALALLALFARLVFSAWRFERRSVPVTAVG